MAQTLPTPTPQASDPLATFFGLLLTIILPGTLFLLRNRKIIFRMGKAFFGTAFRYLSEDEEKHPGNGHAELTRELFKTSKDYTDAVGGRVDEVGKRVDDLGEQFAHFKIEVKRMLARQWKKFITKARERDDGWIMQFSILSRDIKENQEKRTIEITAIRSDIGNLRRSVDILVKKLEEKGVI